MDRSKLYHSMCLVLCVREFRLYIIHGETSEAYTYGPHRTVDFRLSINLEDFSIAYNCRRTTLKLHEAIDISTYTERACISALFYHYTNDPGQILFDEVFFAREEAVLG